MACFLHEDPEASCQCPVLAFFSAVLFNFPPILLYTRWLLAVVCVLTPPPPILRGRGLPGSCREAGEGVAGLRGSQPRQGEWPESREDSFFPEPTLSSPYCVFTLYFVSSNIY